MSVSRPRMSWEQIEALYDAGFTYAKIEELSGVQYTTVQHHMRSIGKRKRRRGTQPGQQKLTYADLEETVKLYHDEGLPLTEVAERLGISGSAVRHRLYAAGRPPRTTAESLQHAYNRGKRQGFLGTRGPGGRKKEPA